MLRTLRANAGSWIIKFLLLAIVIVFIFWGVGSYKSQKASRVAVVNGETISFDDFNKAHALMVENLKYQFGEKLDEKMLQLLNIKEQVLTELVNNKLLAQEARRLNFDVSPEALAQTIRNISAFQVDGSFNNRRYLMILNSMRRSPEEFETLQKEAMLINKLKTFIYSAVKVSDAEVLEWFQYNHSTVNIDYVVFQPNSFTDIHPADEEILSYFDEHKEAYKTQPMIKAQYFRFSPDAYRSKVTISKEAIENYYDENTESFLEPKTVEARHILIKLPQDPDPQIIEEKRVQAENIMKMAKEGKDFAELAKKYSEGPSSTNGGYLGAFRREQMIPAFSNPAFSMNTGDISEPVRTQFGWHIIKVEKVNEEKQKTLEEATPDIEKALTQKEVEYMAYTDAETVYDASFDDDNLSNIAQAKGYQLWTTEFFTKTGPADVSQPAKFADIAFSLETNEISDIVTMGSDYFIMQIVDTKPAAIPDFETVKDTVSKDLTAKIQDEKAQKAAETLLAQLRASAPDENNQSNGPEFVSTGFFKRNETIPSVGFEKAILNSAFLLTQEKPYPESVIKGAKGYYVIRFKERKLPETESFAIEKSNIKENLIQDKQMKTFSALVEELSEKGDIAITEGFSRS